MDHYLLELEDRRNPVREVHRKVLRRFYKLHFSGNETVLEVSSGLGYFVRETNHSGRWVQLDNDLEALKITANSNPTSDYVQGNASNLPFDKEVFDVVFGFNTSTIERFEEHLEESYRVLKHGGLFLSLRDLRPYRAREGPTSGYERELSKMLANVGFVDVTSGEISALHIGRRRSDVHGKEHTVFGLTGDGQFFYTNSHLEDYYWKVSDVKLSLLKFILYRASLFYFKRIPVVRELLLKPFVEEFVSMPYVKAIKT